MRCSKRISRRGGRRRGTALIEFVLCIPLLGFMIAVIFFFGWAVMHQHQVKVSDRYTAWRSARGGGVSEDGLNDTFYRGEAASVTIRMNAATDETTQRMVESVGKLSAEAAMFAGALTLDAPRGYDAGISARFVSGVALWDRLGRAITSDHVVEGKEWRRGQLDQEDTIRDGYLAGFDRAVDHMNPVAKGFADVFRRLYENRW